MNLNSKNEGTIEVETLQDYNATVVRLRTRDFVVTGSSRRDPSDTFDAVTGDVLAMSRALEVLSVKYRKLAQARMNEQANDRANRAKAKEWHAEQADLKGKAPTFSYDAYRILDVPMFTACYTQTASSLGGGGGSVDVESSSASSPGASASSPGGGGNSGRFSVLPGGSVALLLRDGRIMTVSPDGVTWIESPTITTTT
jgi:hypothetical protein